MKSQADDGLVAPSDVALLAGVSRAAVSNWRKRFKNDFPPVIGGTETKPLFSKQAVLDWLAARGHSVRQDTAQADVWAALNLLRGRTDADSLAELVLDLAVARRAEHSVPVRAEVAPELLSRLSDVVARLDDAKLAEVGDFVLQRLARSQGKSGGEFGIVGSRAARLLGNLAATRPCHTLYDPACGVGAALLDAVAALRERSPRQRTLRVVGHDISEDALHVAERRAVLHGVDVELRRGDVLTGDLDPELRADVVILEPPFGQRLADGPWLTDERFAFGPPPRNSADFAWLQLAIFHLSDHGRAFVLAPTGSLFRAGSEGRIREALVAAGCVEAVIGLPGQMLQRTPIPLALWVLRRPVGDRSTIPPVLVIDASESADPEQQAPRWLADPGARDEVPHVEVPVESLAAAGAVLAPQYWLVVEDRPAEVAKAYAEGWAAIDDSLQKLKNVRSFYEQVTRFSDARVMTVGELIEQGVLEYRAPKPKDRYDDLPAELRARVVQAADVRDRSLDKVGIHGEFPDFPELTQENDVLVTTMHTVRAVVDEGGGHLPSTGVYRLRVRDRNALRADYLATCLEGRWNERFQRGAVMGRAPVRDLEIPVLPITEQRDIALARVALEQLQQQAFRLASEAGAVGTALMDAVRHHAPLPAYSPTTSDSEGPQ